MKKLVSAVLATLVFSSAAFADLDTFTYVSHDGNGTGLAEVNAAGTIATLFDDTTQGDMWNGGDQYSYLHESGTIPSGSSYTATVRVISQTQHIDGRWGKAGIVAAADLSGTNATAMSQVAFGNGSQHFGGNAVAVRLAGRTNSDASGGFEDNIAATASYDGIVLTDGDGNQTVANALETRWLQLIYDASDNSFVAGIARDNNGVPGDYQYSDPRTNVPINDDGSHYIGIGYSAHSDLHGDQVTRPDGLHGVTFENWTLEVVPEPSAFSLLGLALIGLLSIRKRNR